MALLRPAAPCDAASVAALVRACFAELAVEPPPSALHETEQTVRAHLAQGGGAVALCGGELAGSVLWQVRDGGLYVGRLAVAPAHRRRGIARALLAAAESEARRRGLPRLSLGTRLALADNRRIFAAAGFREVAMHAHPGYAAPTWVEMEKVLA